MAKAEPGAGDVPITLDGKEHILQPSLECCMAISRLGGGGGAAAVINRLRGLDFDTVVDVIALGTGFTSSSNKKQIGEALFQQGVISLAGDCIEFVHIINNGGRRPSDDDEEAAEEEGETPLANKSPSESSTTESQPAL